ncbi:MAG: cold shock domain-containing protein [Candidatus Eisenbacteria bacterium]
MVEQGRVKWFNNRAGWGFIERPDGSELYLHHDQILGDGFKSLHAGDWVRYGVRQGRRGLYATDVHRLAHEGGGEGASGAERPHRLREKAS